jgi:hypothetical protein
MVSLLIEGIARPPLLVEKAELTSGSRSGAAARQKRFSSLPTTRRMTPEVRGASPWRRTN